MTKDDLKKHMAALAKKAADANDSGDALRFSQAANNLANAACALKEATKLPGE